MPESDIWAIDAVCNLLTPETAAARPSWSSTFLQAKFHQEGSVTAGIPLEAFVEQMDEAKIEHALLIAVKAGPAYDPISLRLDAKFIIDAIERYPDRFSGLAGVDPTEGMRGVKEMETLVRDYGFVGAHLYPHWYGLAPDNARYYPFYAKCCELDIPIQMQVGQAQRYSTERPFPSVGRPITLDTVACNLPELKLVGIHIGWPWTEEMVAVADKHPNVYIGSDAYAPAYWPAAFTHYLNSWGSKKCLYGTDFPVLTHSRTREEIDGLELRETSKTRFLRENAIDLYKLADRLKSANG